MRRLRALPWKKILLLGPLGLLALFLLVFGVAYARTDIPPPSALSQAQATVITYAGGEEVARLGTNRELVTLGQMSDPAQKAVLAAEDRGFYTEPGISPKGIARALLSNIKGGGVQQGGSTITQQYAKNAFLTSQRTYSRKIKEVLISLKMSRERSKSQILEQYLNTIYFGRGAYGIEAASKAYFGQGVTAATLTPAQGAVLASSIRSPSGYEPSKHPEAAKARWDYVLDGMVTKGWLSAADRAAATYPQVVPPGSARAARADLSGPAGHVVDAVQEDLLAHGFGEDALNAGGLTVTTTLDKRAQDAAIAAVQTVDKGDKGDAALHGALVAVVPGDGAVRAYYGGANGSGLDFAGAVPHQPGSSMKPYVLATALGQGISLGTVYDGNSPQRIAGQEIKNSSPGEQGPYDLVRALAASVNTVYFRLAVDVGPAEVAKTAHAMGIPDSVRLAAPGGGTTAGIALGVYEVPVRDQAAGYATLAAQGVEASPYFVAKVTRGGATEYAARPQTRRALSPEVAADTTYAMQSVISSGTGTRARLAGGRATAGKTGTTDASNNVWFCGFTPQLAASVWFGYGDPNRSVPGVGGRESSGGSISAPVWKAFMDAALRGLPELPLPRRAGVGSSRDQTTSPSPSASPSASPSPTPSASPTPTPTPSPSATPGPTATPSASPSVTPTPSRTRTRAPQPSTSASPSPQPLAVLTGGPSPPARTGQPGAGGP